MNFFQKFRASNALDTKDARNAGTELSTSDALDPFVCNLAQVDRSLRGDAPLHNSPVWLHASIMNAVKTRRSQIEARRFFPAARPMTLAGCLLVIALGIWWVVNRPVASPPISIAAATDALDFRVEINDSISQVQVSSLSQELERLNKDLDNATQTLIAALP